MDNNFKIAIIIDSTKDEQFSLKIGQWIEKFSNQRKDSIYELIDIKDYHLSLSDSSNGLSGLDQFKEKIERINAFVFLTQEYNYHLVSSLKNALLLTKKSWYKKVAGIISFGSSDGNRASTQLKEVMNEVNITNVRMEVYLSLFKDFDKGEVFKPEPNQEKNMSILLDQVNSWGKAALAFR